MHGHDECAGNIQQLCVKKHAEDLAQWWSFVQCQNYEGRLRIGLPSVATKCARSARLEWEKSGAAECVGEKYGGGEKSGDGQEGRLLLKKSVETQQKEDIVYVISHNPSKRFSQTPLAQQEELHDPHRSREGLCARWGLEGLRCECFWYSIPPS